MKDGQSFKTSQLCTKICYVFRAVNTLFLRHSKLFIIHLDCLLLYRAVKMVSLLMISDLAPCIQRHIPVKCHQDVVQNMLKLLHIKNFHCSSDEHEIHLNLCYSCPPIIHNNYSPSTTTTASFPSIQYLFCIWIPICRHQVVACFPGVQLHFRHFPCLPLLPVFRIMLIQVCSPSMSSCSLNSWVPQDLSPRFVHRLVLEQQI